MHVAIAASVVIYVGLVSWPSPSYPIDWGRGGNLIPLDTITLTKRLGEGKLQVVIYSGNLYKIPTFTLYLTAVWIDLTW